ncbi:hypothetical protein CPLU01_01072 [Colletotrichum plurivorum]|uniref:Uncharacterized protein n=1 Tax=Colletotrichum plurivorum TaxID=2175906 RepID=A0A8H6U559_9PEZI|nr:hypothetical protein CPLU01_01072 [Colletotrichum plurivorum]
MDGISITAAASSIWLEYWSTAFVLESDIGSYEHQGILLVIIDDDPCDRRYLVSELLESLATPKRISGRDMKESPDTPTSASYKTNVKRTKTKKWVEAKAQNYDGDDWGNDFDEPDEPVPVPPLRPSPGFRQPSPSQATTANLPSNQPPTPRSASASTSRPSQLSDNEQGPSMSSRATAGLPPLQIHVQSQSEPLTTLQPGSIDNQRFIGPESSSIDNTSEKGAYAQPVSPQSVTVSQPPALHTGCEDYPQGTSSQDDSRLTSPASVQPLAQPQATRFPPRKSSMGQNDADRLGNSRSSSANAQPNSRSSSSHPPWVEQRSASPSAARSPPTPSNGTPSPFVRPSDIYRRYGDEKDNDRRSIESGAPGLDSGGGPLTERSVSPAKASTPSVESSGKVRQDGFAEEATPGQGNQRAPLEPVAERRSEYGFDGLLAQPLGRFGTNVQGGSQPAGLAELHESQSQLHSTQEAEQQRRYSSSPRLPDLARMSLFGDDFFSNPGKFASDAPPMPALKQQISSEGSNLPPADAKSALPTLSSASHRMESPQVSDQAVNRSVPAPQTSSASESANPAEPRLASSPLRPSIPGGWVTETRSAGDEQTPAFEKKSAGADSGEVSPISDNEDDEPRDHSSTRVKEGASVPGSIPETTDHAALAQQHADKDDGKAGTDIKPLALLNSRPSDGSPAEFVAPEKLQRELTMSTITSPSPVKESDKLREEIMRSLSPVRPTSDPNAFSKTSSNSRLTPTQGGEDTGPRESTYLHGVYDDYWAAGDDKPDLPSMPPQHTEQHIAPAAGKDVSDVPPLSPRKETAATPPVLGRRFSWEADSGQAVPGPAESPQDSLSGLKLHAIAASAVSPSVQTHDNLDAKTMPSEIARDAEQSLPSATDGTHAGVPSESGGMSHQVSQVSSVPRDRPGSEVIEPPSPVSVATDKNIASTSPPRRLSLAEEKSMVGVSSNPVSPSPPPGNHPALAQSSGAVSPPASSPTQSPALSSQQQQQPSAPFKVANFREIMELPSATERINKYNETRAQFAAMDSGLNNWLVTLKSQHPEHANATASFAANAQNIGQPQSSPAASQPTSQQPYYQQYLNASSSNVNVVPSGRPPAASTPMGSSHSPSSDFKHSSGQVGAKGKGLLLAAGKAGKGLLSKGKNKLRGTGDKSDSSPPPAQSQSKARAERRTSWGIGLGTRSPSQADSHARSHSASFSGPLQGPAPISQTIPEHPATPTPPPQLPPFDSLTRDKHTSAWTPPRPQTPKHPAGPLPDSESEPVSPVSETQSTSAPNGNDKADENLNGGGSELHVPRPFSKTEQSWDPFTGTSLVEDNVSDIGKSRNLSPQTHHTSHAGPAANGSVGLAAQNDSADDDWVVVSPHSPPSGQTNVVSPESPVQTRAFRPTDPGRNAFLVEDGSTDGQPQAQRHVELAARQQLPSQQQPQQAPHVSPTRQSSFVGLPPIRRSSTFGVNLTRRAKKRFSLDEDEDGEGNVLVSSPVVENTANRLQQADAARLTHDQRENHQPTQSVQPARIETGLSAVRKDSNLSHQMISATSTQAATLATESTGVDWRVDDEKRPLDARTAFRPGGPPPPIDTQFAVKNEGRGGQPFGPAMRSQQGMTSPTFTGNPIQHLPPQGPWKLEESHLSEPLAASRHRQSGGSASPYQPSFGFDKETGLPSPAAPRPETQLPPRQKFSEVPPSSAQRYPGLFTAPPQGYPNPGSPTGPRNSYDLGHQANIPSLHRTQTGGSEVSSMGPSGEDDFVRNKRSSGFLKEIGGRLSRSSSREMQNPKMETEPPEHPATSNWRSDGVSEASVATGDVQDHQKRRSSFFLNLRGSRISESGQPQYRDSDVATPSPKTSPNIGIPPEAQQPARSADRKRSFLGPDTSNDSPTAVPNLSRSSTSTAGIEQSGTAKGPPKKRFSGFAGKMFNRTSSQQDLQPPPKPTTSHSVASSLHSHHSGAPGGQLDMLAPLPSQGRERSNTTGSGHYSLHSGNKYLQAAGEEERGRRSSAGGFLSGLFGHRSAHKTQDAQEPIQPGAHHPQFRMQQQPVHQNLPSNLGLSPHMGQSYIKSATQSSDCSRKPENPAIAHVVQPQIPALQLQQGQLEMPPLPASQPSQPSEPCSSTQVNEVQATPVVSSIRDMGNVNQESTATGPEAREVGNAHPLSELRPSLTSLPEQEPGSSVIKQVRDQMPPALSHQVGQSHEQAQSRNHQPAQVTVSQRLPLKPGQAHLPGPQTPPLAQPSSESNAHNLGTQTSSGGRSSGQSTPRQDFSGARALSSNDMARQSDASRLSYTSAPPRALPQGPARSVETENLQPPQHVPRPVPGFTFEASQQEISTSAHGNHDMRRKELRHLVLWFIVDLILHRVPSPPINSEGSLPPRSDHTDNYRVISTRSKKITGRTCFQ